MAPSSSSYVLPTTHTNPHRFDRFLPKPSSLFGPYTSPQLVTSSSILDLPDEGTFKYSIEALLAINQDTAIMTGRTGVLAAQKAEHRRNLANYANQRAARKDQTQKKDAATTRASTPPLNVSGQDMRFRLHRVATSTSMSFTSHACVTSDARTFLLPCCLRHNMFVSCLAPIPYVSNIVSNFLYMLHLSLSPYISSLTMDHHAIHD